MKRHGVDRYFLAAPAALVAAASCIAAPLAAAHGQDDNLPNPGSAFVLPEESNAGQYIPVTLHVPNAGERPLSSVSIDVPAGVQDVTPGDTPGWSLTTERGGEPVTGRFERRRPVPSEATTTRRYTWSGQLPPGRHARFTLMLRLPEEAGSAQRDNVLYLPVELRDSGGAVTSQRDPRRPRVARSKASPFIIARPHDIEPPAPGTEPGAGSGARKTTLRALTILGGVLLLVALILVVRALRRTRDT